MSFRSDNYLILKDPALREKAGVSVLDSDVEEVNAFQKQQEGGAASGLPHHMSKYGTPNAVNLHHAQVQEQLNRLKVKGQQVPPQQNGGGYPYHYFANNRKW